MAITQLRTLQNVLDFMNNFFDTNTTDLIPPVARIEGSIPQDFIDTQANELQNLYTILTFISSAQTVPGLFNLIATDASTQAFQAQMAIAFNMTPAEVTALISSAVDTKAADWDLTRIPATQATLTLRFLTTSNANANISLGTTAQTQGVNPIQYATTVNIVNVPVTLDPVTGLFYIDVPAQAIVAGSASNVPIGAINVIAPPLPGFSTVKNITASTGGTDQETDAHLLNRILIAMKGQQLDTIFGLQQLIQQQQGVQAAFVVDNSDPLMTRGVGNQVDIWFLGDQEGTITDTFLFQFVAIVPNGYILAQQPVTQILSVKVNNVLQTPGVDYTFVPDTGGFSHSVRAKDKVVFITIPNPGDTIVIEYTVNLMCSQLQNLLAQPQNQIPNSDILIRAAIQLPIDLEMLVVFLPTFTASDVKTQIQANLETFFNNLGLGENVFESAVAEIVQTTPGVDHVELPFTKMAVTPGVGTSDISVQENQYARLNTLVFD